MACSGTDVALAVETWCSGTKLKFSATKLFCNVDQNGSWEGFGGCGLDSTGSGQGPVAGCCECSDEPSGSCAIKLVSIPIYVTKMSTEGRNNCIMRSCLFCSASKVSCIELCYH
jgi:hypothetical protein